MKQNKWLRNTECEFLSLLCSQLSQCCRADYCHSLFPAPGGCVALLHRHSQGSKRQTEASRWTKNVPVFVPHVQRGSLPGNQAPIFYLCRSERKRRWRKKEKKKCDVLCLHPTPKIHLMRVWEVTGEPRKLVLDGTQISRCPGREGDDGRRCRDVLSAHCSHVSMLWRGERRPLSLSLSLLISTCFMHTESNEKGNMCSYASYSERVSVFWGQTH